MISFSKVNLISKLLSLREVVIGRDFDGTDSNHSYINESLSISNKFDDIFPDSGIHTSAQIRMSAFISK